MVPESNDSINYNETHGRAVTFSIVRSREMIQCRRKKSLLWCKNYSATQITREFSAGKSTFRLAPSDIHQSGTKLIFSLGLAARIHQIKVSPCCDWERESSV